MLLEAFSMLGKVRHVKTDLIRHEFWRTLFTQLFLSGSLMIQVLKSHTRIYNNLDLAVETK
jgi:hypothetical protein